MFLNGSIYALRAHASTFLCFLQSRLIGCSGDHRMCGRAFRLLLAPVFGGLYRFPGPKSPSWAPVKQRRGPEAFCSGHVLLVTSSSRPSRVLTKTCRYLYVSLWVGNLTLFFRTCKPPLLFAEQSFQAKSSAAASVLFSFYLLSSATFSSPKRDVLLRPTLARVERLWMKRQANSLLEALRP